MSLSEKVVDVVTLLASIIFITAIVYKYITLKPIKIENEEIKAIIYTTECKEGHKKTSYVPSGNPIMPFMSFTHKNDEYNVVVLYNNKKYCISDEKCYYMCKNNVDKEVNCTLITKYYKNGL